MKPLRCLAVSNSYPPDHAGGYELGAGNLLEALAKNCGWRNTVIASVRRSRPKGISDPPLTGFFPGIFGPAWERWRTTRELSKNHEAICQGIVAQAKEADVVLVFNPRRLIYPQWTSILRCDKPAFVFASDYWLKDPLGADIYFSKTQKNGEGISSVHRRIAPYYENAIQSDKLLEHFRGVVFGSHFLAKAHEDCVPPSPNSTVIHWGIDEEAFPGVPFGENRLKVFGFCGRPEKEKGLELALNAFRIMARNDSSLRLLVASDLSATGFGKSMRKKVLGDSLLRRAVTLLSHIPHEELHRRFYSRIGVLLFPSLWEEPFALTILEAMSSGAVVVASSTGGTPEVVDSQTGYLFEPDSVEGLSVLCERVLRAGNENRSRVGNAGLRIRQDHTLRGMSGRIDAFVRALI